METAYSTDKRVLFEPWHLGDAIIAASALRIHSQDLALACQSRWHPLLRVALADGVTVPELIPLDLPYVNRDRKSRADVERLPRNWKAPQVLGIRGDVRDRYAAGRIFPDSSVRMSGWLPFFARRNWLLDLPFRAGWYQVRNRYLAWARLVGVAPVQLDASYRHRLLSPSGNTLALHIGAQWRSRQYPLARELRDLLTANGFHVRLIAGPGDALAPGLLEREVSRPVDAALCAALAASVAVVANDSGPMHLAALLGCRTLVISRISNIDEWLPPMATTARRTRRRADIAPTRRTLQTSGSRIGQSRRRYCSDC